MSRKSGQVKRVFSRIFKERQIYHRSDGVVHFISMSTKTQVALATVVGAALLWVAYSSVNVVFKEQIIVAKERDARVMELNYGRQMLTQQQAYAEIDTVNRIMKQEFDSEIDAIRSRHETLRNMIERSATVTQQLEDLSEKLSEAGAPNGQKPKNGNRVMIDVTPAEPTPRRSRVSVLRRQAIEDAQQKHSTLAPATGAAADAVEAMKLASADLYVEQILLLASLEEEANAISAELKRVMTSAGLNVASFVPPSKIQNVALAQGGPFISPDNMSSSDTSFFHHANRVGAMVDELAAVQSVINNVPLSSPLTVRRRFTSGFGVRRDPITGSRSNHYGIDFAAAWRAPVTATADGVVKFAGVRSGFGRVVEIDHGNGFMTRYAHLNRYTVTKGQNVTLHDKIGELGSSGRSTGPHVHYEILFKGKPKNPQRFIEAGRYVFES